MLIVGAMHSRAHPCPEGRVHLLKLLVSGVVACHIRLVVFAVMQLHYLCADDGFESAASGYYSVMSMPCHCLMTNANNGCDEFMRPSLAQLQSWTAFKVY